MMASRSEPEKEMAAIAIDAKPSPGLVGMFGPAACAVVLKSSGHQSYFDHRLWKRRWCSGNINAFQAFALGSIPGRRIIFLQVP